MQVYLDNSATTQPSEAVMECVEKSMRSMWHNPSALYRPAMEAQKQVEAVRSLCLNAADARKHDLVFTAGGTEADNLAILGYLKTLRCQGRVLVSSVEHPAVSACRNQMEKMGFQMQEIPVTSSGVIDLDAYRNMLDDSVSLIVIMQVNNETGAIQPLEDMVHLRDALCPDAAIHVDGVQGFLRVPIHMNTLNIQSYAFSGHKIHALKGIGGLILQKQHRIMPVVYGGGQERGLRSGTENTFGIFSLGAAVEHFPPDGPEHMLALKQLLWNLIHDAIPAARINGPAPEEGSPHILNISLEPVRSQTMLFALEGNGIYVSAGSACASHKQKISPVLKSMGVSQSRADCALRFSLNPFLTEEDIRYTAECVYKQYSLLSKYIRK